MSLHCSYLTGSIFNVDEILHEAFPRGMTPETLAEEVEQSIKYCCEYLSHAYGQ